MPIINGKNVSSLPNAVTASDVKNAVNETRKNRRVLVKRRGENITLQERQTFILAEGDRLSIVPDRIKASTFTYVGTKTDIQKQIIFSQVADIESKLFKDGIEISENFFWIKVLKFRLPKPWEEVNNKRFTPLLLIIPDQFPDLPTNGFYLPKEIKPPPGEKHLFSRGYGGAYGESSSQQKDLEKNNWNWYCTHIKPEAWSPARIRKIDDWKYGDNLWDVFNLIREVMTDPYSD